MMDGLGQEQERDTCFHVVILSHKSYGGCSFAVAAVSLWNALPQIICQRFSIT